jgi:RimJ/RimL family protein N-acetyltransferase
MIVSDERVAKFVSDKLGFGLCPPWTAMGIERDGSIVAGVVFNHFEGSDIHFTVAGSCWNRKFFQECGVYAFEALGCGRVTAITEQKKVVELLLKLGGKVEGCLRSHFGHGRDGIIVGILKDEYRYKKDN